MSIEEKLEVLARVARALNGESVTWAVGASLLLYLKGIAPDFRDIDLLIADGDAQSARRALDAIALRRPDRPDAAFRTRMFLEYEIGGLELDAMAGFSIVRDGETHSFPLARAGVRGWTEICGERIPLGSVADWRVYYALMGRTQRVAMIDAATQPLKGVGIIRKLRDDPDARGELFALYEELSHADAVRYAMLLARHVMERAGLVACAEMDACFDVCARWLAGDARFRQARAAAFALHRAAREERDPVKVKALRALGQAAATPHVKRHALVASDYAVALANLLRPEDENAAREERLCQISLMRGVRDRPII